MTSKYYINGDNVYNLEEVELVHKEISTQLFVCIYTKYHIFKIECRTKEDMDYVHKQIVDQMMKLEMEMRNGDRCSAE